MSSSGSGGNTLLATNTPNTRAAGKRAAYRSDLDDAQHGAIYFNDDALWSKEALEAARELTRAMERDLAKQHFEDGAEHTEPEAETARGSGVGEFFREPEDAAQL